MKRYIKASDEYYDTRNWYNVQFCDIDTDREVARDCYELTLRQVIENSFYELQDGEYFIVYDEDCEYPLFNSLHDTWEEDSWDL